MTPIPIAAAIAQKMPVNPVSFTGGDYRRRNSSARRGSNPGARRMAPLRKNPIAVGPSMQKESAALPFHIRFAP
jgi:hypothetical protein